MNGVGENDAKFVFPGENTDENAKKEALIDKKKKNLPSCISETSYGHSEPNLLAQKKTANSD